MMKRQKTALAQAPIGRTRQFTSGKSATTGGSLLCCLLLIVYWNSLSGGFHFDDQAIFLDPHIVSSGPGWKIFRFAQTRPLTFLTFHWNFLTSEQSAVSYHAVNVLIHAASTITVLLIARQRLPPVSAFVAAALFAVHPLQTQAVNYVFERATLLAALGALLSLLLFLKGRYWWSWFAFALSLLAKEETVALPVFLLAWNLLFDRRRMPWRYFGAMFGVACLAAARLFYIVHTAPDPTLGFRMEDISPLAYLLTQFRVIWIYVRLYLVPHGLNFDHDVALSRGLLSPPETLAGLMLLLLVIGILSWLAWRKNEPALWALGFFLFLAPSSSIVPVRDVIFEHRTYFPLACLVIATAFVIGQTRGRLWVAAMLLFAFSVTTILRNRTWHDNTSLWTDVVNQSPQKARGYFHLAQASTADPGRARQLYEQGLRLEPSNADAWMNLGLLLLAGNDADGAIRHFRKALDLGGGAIVWNNMGAAYLQQGEAGQGILCFRRALEANPCRFDARVNLIRTLAHTGSVEEVNLAARVPSHCEFSTEQLQRLDQERISLR